MYIIDSMNIALFNSKLWPSVTPKKTKQYKSILMIIIMYSLSLQIPLYDPISMQVNNSSHNSRYYKN